MIAHLQASIVKKDSDKLSPKPLASQIIGAGAFAPDKFSQGAQYVFKANPGFHSPTNIETLTFIVKIDPQAQISACRSGLAQVMRLKGPALREAIATNSLDSANPASNIPAFRVSHHSANEINVLLINWDSEPLKVFTLAQRRSFIDLISSTLDRRALTAALGGAEPAYGVIPATALMQNAENRTPQNTTEHATTLPKLEILCSTDAMGRELASVAQPYLKTAGMDTSIRQVDMARLVEMVLGRKHQTSTIAFEMPVVGVSPWLLFFTKGPFAAFGEPIEQIAEQADMVRSTVDTKERMAGWSEISKRLDALQTSWLPLISRSTYVTHHESVTGVLIDAAGTPYWTHLRLLNARE